MKDLEPDKYTPIGKITCDWTDEKNYLIHYKMLNFFVRHGIRVEKFREIISFKQSKWLECYISFNTQNIDKAKIEVEKHFCKLLSNAFVEKMLENILRSYLKKVIMIK